MNTLLDLSVRGFEITMVILVVYSFAAAAGRVRRIAIDGLRLPIEGPVYVWIGLIEMYFAVIVSPLNHNSSPWLWPIFGAGLVAEVWSIVRVGQIERAAKKPRE